MVESRYLRTRMPRPRVLHRPLLPRLALHRPALGRLALGLPQLGRPALRRLALGLRVLGACTAPLGIAQASAVSARVRGRAAESTLGGRSGSVSAGLDQCVTAVLQAERSATFSGEMTAIPGTARMAMRIEVQERMPAEAAFHTITAPGLGVWRASKV